MELTFFTRAKGAIYYYYNNNNNNLWEYYTLIRDAHEWINEILTVPIYYLAKPQLRERA